MISGNTAEMLRMLEGGQVDFVLADKIYAEAQYNSQSFAKVHFGGYSGSEHAEINMTIKKLLEEQLFLREEGASDRAVLEHMLHKRDLPFASFSRVLTSNVPLSLQALASADKGVFFTYECSASAEGLVPLHGLGDLSEERSLVILTLKKESISEEISTFIEQFRELWNA
jgi:DNA-binding transcriptional LysR family regulator